MVNFSLNGEWMMRRVDDCDWQTSIVPGSVYADLLRNNKIPDPYYRTNEYQVMELSNYDYEYKRAFCLPEDFLDLDQLFLSCKGLDTLCDVFLNDHLVLQSNNMHRTYEIPVKQFLNSGENTINIIFQSPVQYIQAQNQLEPLESPKEAIEGIAHLRKAHYMFGWDWGPKLPDMGIWRDICITACDTARLQDLYVTQKHSNGTVSLDVRIAIQRWCEIGLEVHVDVIAPDETIQSESIFMDVNVNQTHLNIDVKDPKLWWPNNFGDQPLYTIKATLLSGGDPLDESSFKIGLRTLTVKQEKDKWGESFYFEINEKPMFSMGADYIPEDNILSRNSREKTKKLIQDCAKANFNTVRVWGGGFYPEDYFYDLCDEYGLIVWQDLMFACCIYSMTEEFEDNIVKEARDNMKRLRHHASLGLWCGNNEQEWFWDTNWCKSKPFHYAADYILQYEVILPSIAEEIDPATFYWRASPSSQGRFVNPNSSDMGDAHYWDVWFGNKMFTEYRNVCPRFVSEFGLQGMPCMKTIETFTLPEDRDYKSPVIKSHQKNESSDQLILDFIDANFRNPKDFESLVYLSQILQAEGIRYGVEHWRKNRGRCMGAIYWQLNDCWPVSSWSSLDCFGRWKALHYEAKRFYAPVMIGAFESDTSIAFSLFNETTEVATGTLAWELVTVSGDVLSQESSYVSAMPLSSNFIQEISFKDYLDTEEKRRTTYCSFRFISSDRILNQGSIIFVLNKDFCFSDPKLKAEISEDNNCYFIDLTCKAYARFVELDLYENDAIFSDNYFDLVPYVSRRVQLLKKDISKPVTLIELESQIRLRSLFDTYN